MDRTNETATGYTYGGQQYEKQTRTDSQGNTYNVAIPISSLSPVQPLQIPTPQPQNNFSSDIAGIYGNLPDLNQQVQGREQDNSALKNLLSSAYQDQSTIPQQQADMEKAAGIADTQKEVLALQNKLRALSAQQQSNILSEQNKATGQNITGAAVQRNIGDLNRQVAIDTLTTSAILQARQGDLSLAQDQISKAVELKNQAATNKINILKQFYEMNRVDLERSDKKRADALAQEIKRREKENDLKIENQKAIESMIIEASPNAPQSVISNAKRIAEQGGSKLAVAQALGVYGGDFLKNELLREQLKQARVKTSTISADGRELVTQNGVQLVKVTPKEIQDLNDTQIAKNSLVSLVDNMIGSIDKYGTQVLFGKEAGTRSGAKTNLLLAMKNLEKTGALDKGTIDVLSGTIPESEFFATEAAQKAALQQLRDTVVNKTDEYINSYKGTTAETDPRTKRIYEQTGFISTGNPQADEYIRQSMGAVSSVNNSMSTPNAVNAGYVDNQK